MPSNIQTGTASESRTNPLKIILTDDRALSRSVAAVMLTQAGFLVEEACSGPDCLNALDRTDFDAALIDLQMPGMDGFEVATKIRTFAAPVRDMAIIAISGNAEPSMRSKAIESGFDGFVEKPFDAESLIAKIADALSTRRQAIKDQQLNS